MCRKRGCQGTVWDIIQQEMEYVSRVVCPVNYHSTCEYVSQKIRAVRTNVSNDMFVHLALSPCCTNSIAHTLLMITFAASVHEKRCTSDSSHICPKRHQILSQILHSIHS